MAEKSEWMPVFMVTADRTRLYKSHPDDKAAERAVEIDQDLVRIGTAQLREDGAYVISLTAMPLNGQLILREPTQHDRPNLAEGKL